MNEKRTVHNFFSYFESRSKIKSMIIDQTFEITLNYFGDLASVMLNVPPVCIYYPGY